MVSKVSQRSVRALGLLAALTIVLAGILLPSVTLAAPVASAPAMPTYGSYYTVRPGDTLSGIAKYYGTTVSAIMSANGLYSTRIYVGQRLYIPSGSPSTGCSQYYYVRYGDNLSRIAARFGVNTYALARVNGISNPSRIYAGQRLCIPSPYGGGGGYYPPHPPEPYPPQPYPPHPPKPYPPEPYPPQPYPPHPAPYCGQYYVVQHGDNLSRIAQRCGTTVHSLVYLNGIHNPSLIYVGQTLRIY